MSQTLWAIYDIAMHKAAEAEKYASVVLSLQWAQAVLLGLIVIELVSINRKLKK